MRPVSCLSTGPQAYKVDVEGIRKRAPPVDGAEKSLYWPRLAAEWYRTELDVGQEVAIKGIANRMHEVPRGAGKRGLNLGFGAAYTQCCCVKEGRVGFGAPIAGLVGGRLDQAAHRVVAEHQAIEFLHHEDRGLAARPGPGSEQVGLHLVVGRFDLPALVLERREFGHRACPGSSSVVTRVKRSSRPARR